MFALLRFFLALFSSLFKSKSRLEAENAVLRRQLVAIFGNPMSVVQPLVGAPMHTRRLFRKGVKKV